MNIRETVVGMGKSLPAKVGAASFAIVPAFAFAAVDTSAVEGEISSAATSVATIGAAVLLVFIGIAVYKWIRRAL